MTSARSGHEIPIGLPDPPIVGAGLARRLDRLSHRPIGAVQLPTSTREESMSNETLIRAWKDPKFRSTLQNDVKRPAGERLVDIGDEELRSVWGAAQIPAAPSEGYVCGVSGEVTGESCWSSLS